MKRIYFDYEPLSRRARRFIRAICAIRVDFYISHGFH